MQIVALVISVFALSLTASASTEWFFYKHFPWVYDNVTKDWLYLRGTDDGKFYAYRASTTTWEDFTVPEVEEIPEESDLPSTLQLQLHESVTMDFILVQPGTFYMGEKDIAEPVHQVRLTKPYYLGKYEVTQVQYLTSQTGFNYIPNFRNYYEPASNISYSLVLEYIASLNTKHKSSLPENWEICLPTESQWEYACRAGTTTSYSTGDTITRDDANWGTYLNAGKKNVGLYPPNNWGFYDMHGNVQEWTSTHYPNHYTDTYKEDPPDPEPSAQVISRGGSYYSHGDWLVRSAYRYHNYKEGNNNTGFRLSVQEK